MGGTGSYCVTILNVFPARTTLVLDKNSSTVVGAV